MIDESDKSLFRSTVDFQKPLDKDSHKKQNPRKMSSSAPFENYSFLYEANITGSEVITHFKDGLSPKVLKKMKQGNIGSTPSIDLHGYKIEQACHQYLTLYISILIKDLFKSFMARAIIQIMDFQL